MKEIIARIEKWISSGQPVPPGMWIDEAMKLMAFYGTESDKLIDLEKSVAVIKWERISQGDSDAKAESYKRTTEEYAEMKRQEVRVKRIDEYVRLAKKRATLSDNEFVI